MSLSNMKANSAVARSACITPACIPSGVKPVLSKRQCFFKRPADSVVASAGSFPAVSLSKQQQARASTLCQAVPRNSVFLFGFGGNDDDDDYPVTVLKLNVGLFGNIRKFQKDLNDLSNLYDTDDEDSLHAILQGVVLMLLRNQEYCGYAQSAGKVFGDLDEAEQKYNSVVMEERAKFKEETLVNVEGRRERSLGYNAKTDESAGLDNWLCLTMVLAIEGPAIKLGRINSLADLKKALQVVGGVPVEGLVSMELMWTPQDYDDTYTKEELLMDYPTMAQL